MAFRSVEESTAAGRRRAPVADRKHLRVREPDSEQRVTFVELFFDLVHVFAITQISHSLIDDLSAAGVAKAVFLLMVVWWAWIYTTWMTNWFDPASVHVRLVLIACMLCSLLMAAALPHAFEQDGALFGVAYTALQVGRNAAGALLLGRQQLRANFERMLTWSVASGVLWIAGGLASEEARPWLWVAALAVDFAAPVASYRVPRLGRTRTEELPVDGGHFAERFQLFIILALGEQVVLSGGAAADAGLDVSRVLALTTAFAVTAALWWLYFDEVASNSQKVIAEHEDPGRLARDAFSYLHLPIVAGIIAAAVGAEIFILHPDEHEHGWPLVVLIAGPPLYLFGEAAFRWRMARRHSAAHTRPPPRRDADDHPRPVRADPRPAQRTGEAAASLSCTSSSGARLRPRGPLSPRPQPPRDPTGERDIPRTRRRSTAATAPAARGALRGGAKRRPSTLTSCGRARAASASAHG